VKVCGYFMQGNVMAHVANQSMLALREVFGSQVFSHWPPHSHTYMRFLHMGFAEI
jgi:hypothetical protein